MVLRKTSNGIYYREPPYTPEEEAMYEKALYGDIVSVIRNHPLEPPRAPRDQPASSRRAQRRGRRGPSRP